MLDQNVVDTAQQTVLVHSNRWSNVYRRDNGEWIVVVDNIGSEGAELYFFSDEETATIFHQEQL